MIRSLVLSNDGFPPGSSLEFPDIGPGQAAIWGDSFCHDGNMHIHYIDHEGREQSRSIPFDREVPDYCHDDYYIKLYDGDRIEWGRVDFRKLPNLDRYAPFLTHLLALAAGLLAGRRLRPTARDRNPELGGPDWSATGPGNG
jgi:hypothetical protein